MGVRTLIGEADGTTRAAAMYDSGSGWMIGPVWEAEDAEDQIEAFLTWLRSMEWYGAREAVFGRTSHRNFLLPHADGTDPRGWSDAGLSALISFWKRDHVGEDGWLIDPHQCSCGHRHVADDNDEEQGCPSCSCKVWTPGNPLAEKLAAAGGPVLVP